MDRTRDRLAHRAGELIESLLEECGAMARAIAGPIHAELAAGEPVDSEALAAGIEGGMNGASELHLVRLELELHTARDC